MEKTINLYVSTEHVLTPPEIGPVVEVAGRKYELDKLTTEELERLLASPLTENFLNRAKREAAKAAAPSPAPAAANGSDAGEDDSTKKKKQ
jgi:hypothetical protein